MRKYESKNGKTQPQYRILNGDTMSLYSFLFILSHRTVRTITRMLRKIEEIPSILMSSPMAALTSTQSSGRSSMSTSSESDEYTLYAGAPVRTVNGYRS